MKAESMSSGLENSAALYADDHQLIYTTIGILVGTVILPFLFGVFYEENYRDQQIN